MSKHIGIYTVLFLIIMANLSFAAEGDVLWTKILNYGYISQEEKACKIALDSGNNIYLGALMNPDYLWLMKFDSTGNTIWTQELPGKYGHWDFYPCDWDITVDSSDNIYVLASRYPNIFIAKYDSLGTLLWTNIYNYPGNELTEGYGIDAENGYIYITGSTRYTQGGVSDYYLILIKYELNGNFQWAVTNNFCTWGAWNVGYDVDVDNNYVYVAGCYHNGVLVVKYTTNGNVVWYTNACISNGHGYGIDVKGDIFVTGDLVGREDIFTARIDQNGNLIWTNSYDGPANNSDKAFGISVDSQTNNIIIGTIDYDFWGASESDIFIQKKDKNGTSIWSNIYDYNAAANDFGYDVAVDSSDNIYVVGYVYSVNNKWDIFLRKYDAAGNIQWTRFYNRQRGSEDNAMDVAVDTLNNIYVIGTVETTNRNDDIWLAKYDSAGNNIWSKTIDGGINEDDEGIGIDVDSAGNIYISANVSTNIADPWRDYIMVAKYDTDGNEIWKDITGSTNENGAGKIVVDNAGNIYVTGSILEDEINFDINIWIRKYDNAGNEVWTKTYDNTSQADSMDYGRGICVDNKGYLYVIGHEEQSGENANIWIRKIEVTNGNTIWTRTYNNVSINGDDIGFGIDVDSANNVIGAGFIQANASDNSDAWLRQYTANGSTNWTKIDSSTPNVEAFVDLTIDINNNIYVTGVTNYGEFTGTGALIVRKYDSVGNIMWSRGYTGLFRAIGWGIALATNNDIVVVGIDEGSNYGDILIRKYDGGPPHLMLTKIADAAATNAGGNRGYPALLFKISDADNHNIEQLKIKNNGTMVPYTDVQYVSLYYYPSYQFAGNCYWSNSYSAYVYNGNLLSNTNFIALVVTSSQGIPGRTFQGVIPQGGVKCSAGFTNSMAIINNNSITRIQEIIITKLEDMPAINVSTNATNVSVLAFKISDYYDDLINTIRITNFGTMLNSDDVADVKLFYDTDNSTNYTPADVFIQKAIWNPLTGTYDFTNINVFTETNLIVTIDTSDTLSDSRTFKAGILYGDVYCAQGVNDNNSITNANPITASVSHFVKAKSTNITWPPQNTVSSNQKNVAVLAFKYFCTHGHPLKVLRITNKGTMVNGTDISAVKVFKDFGIIGNYDDGIDLYVATLEWDNLSGKWTNNNLSIGAGTNILVTIDTAPTLRNKYTFQAAIASTNDLQCANGKAVSEPFSNITVLTADTVAPGPVVIHNLISGVSTITVYCSTATNNPYYYCALYGTNTNTYFPSPAVSTNTQIVITGLDDATVYYIRVFAKDGAGNKGPVSSETNIETKDGTPPTFKGIESINVLEDGSVVICWLPAVDNKTPFDKIVYNIYIATSPGKYNFASPSYSVVGSTIYTIKGLSSGKYYFIVRAMDEAGNEDTNLNEHSIFVVTVASTLDNAYIYPNPVYGDMDFTITELTKKVTIRIYDVRGILIKEIEKDSDLPYVTFSPSKLDLSTGVYFISLESSDGKYKRLKLVYVK